MRSMRDHLNENSRSQQLSQVATEEEIRLLDSLRPIRQQARNVAAFDALLVAHARTLIETGAQ